MTENGRSGPGSPLGPHRHRPASAPHSRAPHRSRASATPCMPFEDVAGAHRLDRIVHPPDKKARRSRGTALWSGRDVALASRRAVAAIRNARPALVVLCDAAAPSVPLTRLSNILVWRRRSKKIRGTTRKERAIRARRTQNGRSAAEATPAPLLHAHALACAPLVHPSFLPSLVRFPRLLCLGCRLCSYPTRGWR